MHRSSLALYLTAGVTNLQQRGQKKSWRGQLQFGFASKWYPNLCPFKSFRGQCVCKPLDHWMLADFLIFEGQTQPVSSLPCWLLESHPIASEHAVLRAAQAVLSLEPPQIGHLFRPTKMATFMVKMYMLICVICVRGYIRYVYIYIYMHVSVCVCIVIYAPGPATPPLPPPPMGWVPYTGPIWDLPPPPLWCGGGVALSPSPPCGVVGVWYGMLGMYGVYGRSGMACLESMVCLVGMVCMAWVVGIVWMVGMVCKSVGYGMFDMTVCMVCMVCMITMMVWHISYVRYVWYVWHVCLLLYVS